MKIDELRRRFKEEIKRDLSEVAEGMSEEEKKEYLETLHEVGELDLCTTIGEMFAYCCANGFINDQAVYVLVRAALDDGEEVAKNEFDDFPSSRNWDT